MANETQGLRKEVSNLSRSLLPPEWGRPESVRPQPADAGAYLPREGKSHVSGPVDAPLLDVTVPGLLLAEASRRGYAEAVVFHQDNIFWTWSEFSRRVDETAAGFLALGLRPGNRVGIWAPNRPEWLVTQFATARAGLVLVTINPAYRVSELEYALNKAGCRALVLAESSRKSDYIEMLQSLAPELETAEPGPNRIAKLPRLRHVIHTGTEARPGMIRFSDLPAMAGPAQRARLDSVTASLSRDDPINIQFTSGTTGSPKGATLTHRNIVNNAHFVTASIGLTETDSLCIPVPLYHCFGMVMATLGCMTKGARMIFPGESFDPITTLDSLAKYRCTATYGVPTMFISMLDHEDFSKFDLKSLRTGIMAGAPCPVEVMRRVIAEMNMSEVTIAYGMTETSPVSFQSHTNDPIERRVSTVGRIHPHVECKVIGSDGETVPIGESGELCTRGYSVMAGYWNDPAQTEESIDSDGWMHTGDLARIDEEGFCDIVGRVKDMLIRGGENIYPREIEEFLYGHPKVQIVQAFGVPDPKYGEEICIWIVPRPGESPDEEEIREYCRDRIAHFKVPRYIRFREELPMTVTGKPQKFRMRKEMMRELGLRGGT